MIAYEFEIPGETLVKVSVHLKAEALGPLIKHLDTLRNSAPKVPENADLTRVMDALAFARSATSPNVYDIPEPEPAA